MRPLGGWLFGRIADRRGRKNSLVLSVLLMCAGSLADRGAAHLCDDRRGGAVLLLVVRLVQGLAGRRVRRDGDLPERGRRRASARLLASFQYVTLIGGQLLALLVLVAAALLPEDAIRAWAWRIPFVVGGVLAIVVMYLRSTLQETGRDTSREGEAGTLRALAKHPRALMIVLGLTAGGSLLFYTFTTYMQKYLVNTARMSTKTASLVMTAALFIYMVVQPVFGRCRIAIGRRSWLHAVRRAGNGGHVSAARGAGRQ